MILILTSVLLFFSSVWHMCNISQSADLGSRFFAKIRDNLFVLLHSVNVEKRYFIFTVQYFDYS